MSTAIAFCELHTGQEVLQLENARGYCGKPGSCYLLRGALEELTSIAVEQGTDLVAGRGRKLPLRFGTGD